MKKLVLILMATTFSFSSWAQQTALKTNAATDRSDRSDGLILSSKLYANKSKKIVPTTDQLVAKLKNCFDDTTTLNNDVFEAARDLHLKELMIDFYSISDVNIKKLIGIIGDESNIEVTVNSVVADIQKRNSDKDPKNDLPESAGEIENVRQGLLITASKLFVREDDKAVASLIKFLHYYYEVHQQMDTRTPSFLKDLQIQIDKLTKA
jgi:hypothetical protein